MYTEIWRCCFCHSCKEGVFSLFSMRGFSLSAITRFHSGCVIVTTEIGIFGTESADMMKTYLSCLAVMALLLLMTPDLGHSVTLTWTKIDGLLRSISIGEGGMWGVNKADMVFYRKGTYHKPNSMGTGWLNIHGLKMAHVSVGKDVVWGVARNGDVYYRTGIAPSKQEGERWVKVDGSLKHVSVSDKGHVWGVSFNGTIYSRAGVNSCSPAGLAWIRIPGSLKQISVGGSGVWGVNANDIIFYRDGTYGDPHYNGTSWRQLEGGLKYVSSGQDVVVGVNAKNQMYIRQGTSHGKPEGLTWVMVPGQTLTVVDVHHHFYWGVDSADRIYHGTETKCPA
ncbi:hypothetical protein ACOMHN_016852 [Nucella lapillus]